MSVTNPVLLSSDLVSTALLHAPVIACIRDHDMRYVWVNKAHAEFVEVSSTDLLGNDSRVLPAGMRAITNPLVDEGVLRTGEPNRRFETVINAHGEILDVLISTSLLVLDDQKLLFQLGHDVTSVTPNGSDVVNLATTAMTSNSHVSVESRVDPITEAFNPRSFEQQAIESLAAANHGGSLLLLDADNFPTIIEQFGVESGDLVLRRVADILQSATRAERDVIGRLSGDVLAVAMPGVSATEARAVATRVRCVIAERPVRLFAEPMHVQVSIGVASASNGPSLGFDAWRRAADEALQDAKLAGKDQIATRELR